MLFGGALIGVRRVGLDPLTRRDAALLAAAGLLLAAHFWSWIASLDYTTVASSVVLVSMQPFFVALLSAGLLGERPGRAQWWAIATAVTGAVVIGWGDVAHGRNALFGDVLALAGARVRVCVLHHRPRGTRAPRARDLYLRRLRRCGGRAHVRRGPGFPAFT